MSYHMVNENVEAKSKAPLSVYFYSLFAVMTIQELCYCANSLQQNSNFTVIIIIIAIVQVKRCLQRLLQTKHQQRFSELSAQNSFRNTWLVLRISQQMPSSVHCLLSISRLYISSITIYVDMT